MRKIEKAVQEAYDGMNIRRFLQDVLGLSATLVKRVKFGGVFINGENVHMRATLKTGDTVTVNINEKGSGSAGALDIALDIVYEDAYMLAVCKPKNMPTHPSRGNSLPTLANAVAGYLGEDFVFRAVNRLDRDTSGIVLIAKDAVTSSRLCAMMKKREFVKKYEAVLHGVPDPRCGTVDAPIERECDGSMKRCVRADGKRAVTDYLVIKENGEKSVCEFTLHTGRTHQIRVHASHIGHPLIGDSLYGGGEGTYLLHCKQMTLVHPYTGEALTLLSESGIDI